MFTGDDLCLFGQCGAAQTHLANQGVAEGDVFLLFGLFREAGGELHHRIYGYCEIAEIIDLTESVPRDLAEAKHPHAWRCIRPTTWCTVAGHRSEDRQRRLAADGARWPAVRVVAPHG